MFVFCSISVPEFSNIMKNLFFILNPKPFPYPSRHMYPMLSREYKPILSDLGNPEKHVGRKDNWVVRNKFSRDIQRIYRMGRSCSFIFKNCYRVFYLLPVNPEGCSFLTKTSKSFGNRAIEGKKVA